MHKTLEGDVSQKGFLLNDYVERLFGATEIQIFEAVEHFIDKDHRHESRITKFPQFIELKDKVFEDKGEKFYNWDA